MYTPKDIAEAIAKMIPTGDMDASTNAMCDLADRVASENGLSEEWWRAIKRGETPLITIYERPVDFPDEYVAGFGSWNKGASHDRDCVESRVARRTAGDVAAGAASPATRAGRRGADRRDVDMSGRALRRLGCLVPGPRGVEEGAHFSLPETACRAGSRQGTDRLLRRCRVDDDRIGAGGSNDCHLVSTVGAPRK
jgi:hypothetical protein